MALGHNNQGSTPAKGTLIVNGNMNVDGTVNVGDRSTYHNSSSEAHVTVTDTLTVGSGESSRTIPTISTVPST